MKLENPGIRTVRGWLHRFVRWFVPTEEKLGHGWFVFLARSLAPKARGQCCIHHPESLDQPNKGGSELLSRAMEQRYVRQQERRVKNWD